MCVKNLFIASLVFFCHICKITESSVNLARNKHTSQSVGWKSNPSSLAVDGKRNCNDGYTHTAENKQFAWWNVDLGGEFEIRKIQIFYRNESGDYYLQRLNGYSVNITRSLNPLETWQCYKDRNDNVLPSSLSPVHICRHLGRYVNMSVERLPGVTYKRYDNSGAVINLCEFEVYGCQIGRYGNGNCDSRCSDGCHQLRCDPDKGTCNCTDGWIGVKCEERMCKKGFFGKSCNPCPSECTDKNCNSGNGKCIDGCNPSYYGDYCNLSCPMDCHNSTCQRDSGSCFGCKSGYYGAFCNSSCPMKCKDKNCNQYGNCIKCEHPFQGVKCTECVHGFYGILCIPCSNGCANDYCNKYHGNCTYGCKDHFFGDFCNKSCPENCKNKKCKQDTGDCSDGCRETVFGGRKCNVCQNGTYGTHCNNKCPSNCKHELCNGTDGSCLYGCKNENITGNKCEECREGLYGVSCNSNCNVNCKKCDRSTGNCQLCLQGKILGKQCSRSTKATQEPERVNETNIGPIIGGVVAVTTLVLVLVVFVWLLKRRRRNNRNEKQAIYSTSKKAEKIEDNLPIRSNQKDQKIEHVDSNNAVSNDGDIGYINSSDVYVNLTLTEVPVSELSSLISRKTAEKEFEIEYNKLPKGSIHPSTIGEKPENKAKNRFLTTFPYDHSRVVLKPDAGLPKSDYINANYIDGVEKRYAYVATQGPKPITVWDFWKMVWQEQSGKIIMLTNLFENEKAKCEKYWPENGEEKEEDHLKVTMENEKEYAFFCERSLQLYNKKTKEGRKIIQFHFTMWPDHGTPDPVQLMLFHRKVRTAPNTSTGPWIVHCAAGIGRTGTFIALDTLHEYGDKTGKIDIFEYVIRMRKDRMNMIQTLDQYVVLHEALLESFQYTGRAMSRSRFLDACSELQNGKPKNQTHVFKEFQNLSSLRPVYGIESYDGALDKENRRKSRNQNILAVEKYRPYLMSQHSSRSNFINAVMLPSCRKRCGYFATHYPLDNTVVDFWCMVFDHDSTTIALLDEISDKDQVLRWYPEDNKEMNVDAFKIKKVADSHISNSLREIDFILTHQDEEKSVKMIMLRRWPTGRCVPQDKTDLLKLIEMVMTRQTASPAPVTVVCSDGARCCGLFCTVSNVILNLRIEDEIDIFHTVRQLQIRRPQFITDYEEYKNCYEMVKSFLESTNIYANV